jgi:hypothetical protein
MFDVRRQIDNSDVAAVFQEYPPKFKKNLLRLRKIIFDTAKEIEQIEELVETLKWGEPIYLPKKKNIVTTIRIHWLRTKPNQYGMYFNCNTSLIPRIKRRFGNTFAYEGKRAIVFNEGDDLPSSELRECVKMALTYHLDKKRRR